MPESGEDKSTTIDRAQLGSAIGSDEVYEDIPYALVQRFSYQHGESYWLYTSEHTASETLEDIWPLLANTRYQGSEPCSAARNFSDQAKEVCIHHFVRLKGVAFALSFAAFSKVVLSAEILGQLR